MNRRIILVLFVVLTVAAGASADTAFTYQGELTENGQPADGLFDMSFALWDAALGGTQVGAVVDTLGVAVGAGRFTVLLDFGAAAFDNAPRWLEITVGGYVMAPRTAVTRAPYAVQTRGIYVDEDENVGIGTTSPERQLVVEDSAPVVRISGTDTGPTTAPTLEFRKLDAPGIHKPLGMISFIDQNDVQMASITGTKVGSTDAELAFNATPGETAPMRINSSGVQFRDGVRPAVAYGRVIATAAYGTENITMVDHYAAGEYHIYFDPPLQASDIVVASLEDQGVITARVVESTGKVYVETRSGTNLPFDRVFSFVVFRP